MSVLLRPSFSVNQSLLLTSMMAVAVARAIRENSDVEVGIKWVNDVYYKKKKISGILAEGVINEGNGFDYVIIGVSLNLLSSIFPPKLSDIVSEVFSEEREGIKDRLARCILSEFFSMYENFNNDNSFIDEYKSLSILDGKKVYVNINKVRQPATVLGINSDAHLEVRLRDGSTYVLNSTAELAN
jgi:BirA family biotin operon repressor/biotin-[acetyl-CoA-carboxylase] ligase